MVCIMMPWHENAFHIIGLLWGESTGYWWILLTKGQWCFLCHLPEQAVEQTVELRCHGNHVTSLQWRHNGRDSISNHQPHDCLLNRLFRRRSKKTSKFRVTGLCVWNSPGTGEFPTQMASDAENVSIWWRHHDHCNVCNTVVSVNLLSPSDAIRSDQPWPSLVQVMACCLMASSHCLNNCWLITNEAFWRAAKHNFIIGDARDIHPWYQFKKYYLKITAIFPRGQWVNSQCACDDIILDWENGPSVLYIECWHEAKN